MESISFLDMLNHYSLKIAEISDCVEKENELLSKMANISEEELHGEFIVAFSKEVMGFIDGLNKIEKSLDDTNFYLSKLKNDLVNM